MNEYAFPTPEVSQNTATGETTIHQSSGGMTLRDYFAAAALTGLATRDGARNRGVANAYALADAMLKERGHG